MLALEKAQIVETLMRPFGMATPFMMLQDNAASPVKSEVPILEQLTKVYTDSKISKLVMSLVLVV